MRFYWWVLLIAVIVLVSCKHKPFQAETQAPVVTYCDTFDLAYSKYVKPIFRQYCYECHSTAVVGENGLDLEDTTSLKKYLSLDYRGDSVYGSLLYHCILHSSLTKGMPPTYTIDSCSINMIHAWIDKGAPVNN